MAEDVIYEPEVGDVVDLGGRGRLQFVGFSRDGASGSLLGWRLRERFWQSGAAEFRESFVGAAWAARHLRWNAERELWEMHRR